MLRLLRANGFEFEKSYPGFFVLQAGAAGFITGILLLLYVRIQTEVQGEYYGPPRYSWLIFGSLFFVFFFVFVCVGLGAVIRFISWFFNLRMKLLTRIVLVYLLIIGLSYLLAYLTGDPVVRPTTLAYLVPAFITGLPTAFLVGSRVGLGKTFSFGTIRVGNRRTTTSNKPALVAMALLRIMCGLGFVIWSLLQLDYWRVWHESQLYIAITSFLAVYLLSAFYLSYRSPRPVFLIGLSFLLNLLLIMVGSFAYSSEEIYFQGLTKPFAISCFVLAFLLAICVAARATVSIVESENGNVGLQEIPTYQTTCLGTVFQSWQSANERTTLGGTT